MNPLTPERGQPLRIRLALLLSVAAVLSFHLAYYFKTCHLLIVLFLYGVFRLTDLATPRRAFYFGFVVGLACYSPHLFFFWHIFGAVAAVLWVVLSFWLGLFILVGQSSRARWGPLTWGLVAPLVWTGLEFFRSELYYLRFSWLSPGYVFDAWRERRLVGSCGVYGAGFLLMAWVAFIATRRLVSRRIRTGWALGLIAASVWVLIPRNPSPQTNSLVVTGIQLEFPSPPLVKSALDGALKKFPRTDVMVLSEYTFLTPVPESIRDWCRLHRKWLVAGGERPTANTNYYDTAFVIDPEGKTAFQQAKCVPVQFMADGLPATNQDLWNSPWGKIGLGICYDASYSRVTDELIRQGAQALIFPTMDLSDWGKAQHQLHARIAPMRAAEYGVPVFRVCSSGISELVEADGRVAASAPYPGADAMLSGPMELTVHGRLPPDRVLARFCVAFTTGIMLWLLIGNIVKLR